MGATTVRVDDAVKQEIDRLQGHVQAETGERLSHNALLQRLVAFARRHEALFLSEDKTATRIAPTAEQLADLLAGVEDWGVETDASRIDDVLYGGPDA